MDMSQQLAAAMNNRSVTDEDGKVIENDTAERETAEEESATSKETTSEPEETKPEAPEEAEASEKEGEVAEDEEGNKYVPQSRFNKVYGESKQTQRKLENTERELTALKNQLQQGADLLQGKDKPGQGNQGDQQQQPSAVSKADILELKMALPQFDSTKPEYSETLDKLAADIFKANPGISPLEAGKRAIELSKEIATKEQEVRTKARTVKTSQSDTGLSRNSGVRSRSTKEVDPNKMSLEEKEEWLKQNGMW